MLSLFEQSKTRPISGDASFGNVGEVYIERRRSSMCARTRASSLCAPAAPALPPAPLVHHWSRQWHSLAPAARALPPPISVPSRVLRQLSPCPRDRRAPVPQAAELTCPRNLSLRVPDMRTPALMVCVLELSGDKNVVPLGGKVSRNLGAKTCGRGRHFGHRLLGEYPACAGERTANLYPSRMVCLCYFRILLAAMSVLGAPRKRHRLILCAPPFVLDAAHVR